MTIRYSIIEAPEGKKARKLHQRLVKLWHAAQGICGICGKDMPQVGDMSAPERERPSLEHVFPKHLKHRHRYRDRPYHFAGTIGNSVAAHWRCNNAKGNRFPTGCEIIWLLAVNALTGETGAPS